MRLWKREEKEKKKGRGKERGRETGYYFGVHDIVFFGRGAFLHLVFAESEKKGGGIRRVERSRVGDFPALSFSCKAVNTEA